MIDYDIIDLFNDNKSNNNQNSRTQRIVETKHEEFILIDVACVLSKFFGIESHFKEWKLSVLKKNGTIFNI